MFPNTPNLISTTGDDKPTRSLISFVWRMSGWHQVGASVLALAIAGLTVVPLELQRRIVDDALAAKDAMLLGVLCAIYLAAILASGVIKFALRLYQGWLADSAILYCRSHLTRLYADDSIRREDGTAMSVVTTEIEAVGGFVGSGISDPVSQAGMLLAIATYMAVVEPVIAAIGVLFLAPQVMLVPVIQRRLNALVERRVSHLRSVGDKITGADGDLDPSTLQLEFKAIYLNRIAYYVWKFIGKAALNFLNALAPLLLLAVGGWMVVADQTEIGVIVAFISGLSKMADPLRDLIAYYRQYAQAAVKHDLIATWMVGDQKEGR